MVTSGSGGSWPRAMSAALGGSAGPRKVRWSTSLKYGLSQEGTQPASSSASTNAGVDFGPSGMSFIGEGLQERRRWARGAAIRGVSGMSLQTNQRIDGTPQWNSLMAM